MSSIADLPQIERILSAPGMAELSETLSRPMVLRLTAEVVQNLRERARQGEVVPAFDRVVESIRERCRDAARRRLVRVINATGVLLHSNLGRAPLDAEVWKAAAEPNTGYSNLELDLDTGKRGDRGGIVPELLAMLVEAEAGLVVNNTAAALLLMLIGLARGRDVLVSRSDLVQIGGGLRIPDLLALSGAHLVEVGTTNVTLLADYTRALSPRTAMVLQVHKANFKIRGFTAEPPTAELAQALPPGVVLAVDQGSGTTTEDLPGEVQAGQYLRQGAHLVCFAGDKVLGGPQAGLIAGEQRLIEVLARHPLLRTLRPGKTVYSLLEEVLVRKLSGWTGQAERLLQAGPDELKKRGRRLLRGIGSERARLVPSSSTVGGGSSPDETFPSMSVEIPCDGKAEEMLARLRDWDPPIIATVRQDSVFINLATVDPAEINTVRACLESLLGED